MKRCLVLFLAVAILCGTLFQFDVKAADTEFAIYDSKSTKKSTVTIYENGYLAIQFKVNVKVQKIGIFLSSAGEGKELEQKVYKWNKNRTLTMNGDIISTQTVSDWVRKSIVEIDFGGGLDAGEYMYVVKLTKGESIDLQWYSPAPRGICCYVNGHVQYGSPMGSITTVDASSDIFDFCSDEVDYVTHTAEPESTIAPDSKIATLGVDSTQYSFVDGLGRSAVTYQEAGNVKEDKYVGIFYWTWHLGQSKGKTKAINVNSILEEYPDAKNDYNHEIWKTNTEGAYWWNEPLWGYYTESDDYVLRKHAELLAEAGVDFVVFDCTNGTYDWADAYMNLLRVWSKAREDGVKTPQIAFMLSFGDSGNTIALLTKMYDRIYANGLYQDLWFYFDGKPLVMAHPDHLSEFSPLEAEILDFFTFRSNVASYFSGDCYDTDQWGWLSTYPQALYYKDGKVEMTTVGIAQNSNYITEQCSAMNGPYNTGRSYTYNKNFNYTYKYCGETITVNSSIENSKLYGLNFQEQWDYALEKDPQVVFVTGWNEWIAGRYDVWGGVENAFPDQCNDENSRDIEPSKGDLKDYYYYQLVNNIRRFKGMSVPVSQTKSKTIDINGSLSQWDDKKIVSYNNYANNTLERDAVGWAGIEYKGDAIRNDFVTSKVSYDKNNIYFYVETASDITSSSDENWMMLLLDTISSEVADDGFEGFEFIINRSGATANTVTVEKFNGGWSFEKICDASYVVSGNVMQIAVPRSSLGLTDSAVNFNFKWCDDNLTDGDIMTLYTDGDTAPLGRFTYSFSSVKTKKIGGCGSVIENYGCIVVVVALGALVLLKKKRI